MGVEVYAVKSTCIRPSIARFIRQANKGGVVTERRTDIFCFTRTMDFFIPVADFILYTCWK